MAYLGQSNSLYDPTRVTPTTVQTFNGDGVTTQFTLQYSVLQSIDIEVLVENVFQQPDYAYTAVGNLITFSSAPPVGSGNIYVRFGKVTGLTGTVPDGSITSSKLANNIRLLATDMYTANGVATQWTLSDTPADANSLIVTVNGVGQAAPRNYTVSGSTITFTDPPNNGANVVIRNVGFRTTQTLFAFPSGTQMVQPVITGGSANNMTLTNVSITGTANNVTLTNPTINGFTGDTSVVNIGSGQIYKDTSGNVGIGTSSPVTKLQVSATGSTPVSFERTGSNGVYLQLKDASGSSVFLGASNGTFAIQTPGSSYSDKLLIDSSGNLGLGVTPSAWSSGKAIQIGTLQAGIWGVGDQIDICSNAYYDSAWKAAATKAGASLYEQALGKHYWYVSGSVTAGNAISFTQAMTLTASGYLLVGRTSTGDGGASVFSINSGALNPLQVDNSHSSSPYGAYFTFSGAAPNNSSNYFLTCVDTSAARFILRSNGGLANYSAYNANLSDERVKTEITPAPLYLNKINSIEVVNFKYKDQTHDDPNLGVIAQQVLSVAPELVDEDGFGETPEDGIPLMAIYETDLKYAMLKAIQELSAKVDAQQEEINQLKGVN